MWEANVPLEHTVEFFKQEAPWLIAPGKPWPESQILGGEINCGNPANLPLIAAAPALYAALESICAERDALLAAQGEDEDITGEEGRHFIKKSWQKWAQARAALLLARPEGGKQ